MIEQSTLRIYCEQPQRVEYEPPRLVCLGAFRNWGRSNLAEPVDVHLGNGHQKPDKH